jgi:Ca2+-binding RTX toxin-like protein
LVTAAIAILSALGLPGVAAEARGAGGTCRGRAATIVGTDGNDRIEGTIGGDVIIGLRGDDVIYAKGGGDVVCGGNGSDRLLGNEGRDSLTGGGGVDSERGGPGADRLRSGGGEDTFYGDYMYGGPGDDRLIGDTAAERMWPGPGRDRVVGGGTTLSADTVMYTQAAHGVHVDLAAHRATGQGRDVLLHIQDVVGSRHNDVIKGTNKVNDLSGGLTAPDEPHRLGHDTLRGRGGIDFIASYTCLAACPSHDSSKLGGDVLYGGSEDDFLRVSGRSRALGGRGQDEFIVKGRHASALGGRGHDDFLLQLGRKADVRGGRGPDLVEFLRMHGMKLSDLGPARVDMRTGRVSSPQVAATIVGIESVYGTPGDDLLLGDRGANRLGAGGGNDHVKGRGGDDHLSGGEGTDVLRGGAGADACVKGEDVSGCEL